MLFNAFSKPFQKRNITDARLEKLTRVHDIIELLRQMDKHKLPTSWFVADAFGILHVRMPRIKT